MSEDTYSKSFKSEDDAQIHKSILETENTARKTQSPVVKNLVSKILFSEFKLAAALIVARKKTKSKERTEISTNNEAKKRQKSGTETLSLTTGEIGNKFSKPPLFVPLSSKNELRVSA